MSFKYKPSKLKRMEFAKKMEEIDHFCEKNNISKSRFSDSYYFELNNKKYRVSNHTVNKSNTGCYDWKGDKVRDSYHQQCYDVEITASKIRIIEIYNNLKNEKKLNKRGKIISWQ